MFSLYPLPLIESELRAHKHAINDYQQDLSASLLATHQLFYKPDLALIKSQPELTLELRAPLLDFLYKVTKRTKLAPGIFHDAVRLFDRYCSKRVVLKAQAQLVGCTCVWLAAKHEGGCNHIVNSLNKPIPGRYVGPTQRSRIPRLVEFVQLCGPSCGYDEGMFVQMERHILNTLNWSISSVSIYNWCLGLHELQLMNSAVDDCSLFDFKKVFYMKNFMAELSLYSPYFIMQDPASVSVLIKKLVSILILNEESHFQITPANMQKILNDNKVDNSQRTHSSENVFESSEPRDSLLFFNNASDNDDINRLIYAIATVSNTIYQNYTNTEYKEINSIIAKIHKVSVSHIMALKEEEKELKRQQEQQEQLAQQLAQKQQQQQQQIYLNVSGSCSSISNANSPSAYSSDRSPSVYSSGSSCSDYEDLYSTFSRKGSYDTASSAMSTPLPSPTTAKYQKQSVHSHQPYMHRGMSASMLPNQQLY